jgi:hypothetical protein
MSLEEGLNSKMNLRECPEFCKRVNKCIKIFV